MNPNEFPELRSFFNEKEQIIARRELYNTCLLERTTDCRRYWKAENIPPLAEYMAKYT